MKTILYAFITVCILACGGGAKTQTIESFNFNLYTDSLKKGTYNYINVDGKLSNGTWLPLTDKHLIFSASSGHFEGNSLFIDKNIADEKVTVKVALRSDTSNCKSIVIYVKKMEDNEVLKTEEEILRNKKRS
jgi:hypothetical protein